LDPQAVNAATAKMEKTLMYPNQFFAFMSAKLISATPYMDNLMREGV